MPKTEAKKRADAKANKAIYDTFVVNPRKDSGLMPRLDAYCALVGKSRRTVTLEALEEYLANHDTST